MCQFFNFLPSSLPFGKSTHKKNKAMLAHGFLFTIGVIFDFNYTLLGGINYLLQNYFSGLKI